MSELQQFAAAKVNLTLKVIGRRPDGYHELESLVAFADVGDTLTLDPDAPVDVVTTGPFAHSIAGANLVAVTLAKLAGLAPSLRLGAIRLDKRLPVAAGIGGGSADAAAVLRLARDANPDVAGAVDWAGLARALGADVPVCLGSIAAWMRGVGERIDVVDPALPLLDVVLVNPLVPVPADKTAQVFRRFQAGAARTGPSEAKVELATRSDVLALMARVGNDLATAAMVVVPAVRDVLAELQRCPGVDCAGLSGGGPTCFAVFADRKQAEAAAMQLAEGHPDWWVTAARLR